MNLEAGSEKKFIDFISNLDEKDKIALITHTDLDGLAAGIVANKIIDANLVKLVGYTDLNVDLIEELKSKGINKIVITDLYIKDPSFVKSLEEFSEVLILDHHLFEKDWNSDKTVFVKVEEGYCAGYLCYKLFGKIKDLSSLDWLVACSCVSDFCHVKTSEWLSEVFEKYGDTFEFDDGYVRKSGKFWDLQYTLSLAMIYFRDDLKHVFDSIGEKFGEIGDLGKHAEEVNADIERNIAYFDKTKEEFSEGFFGVIKPVFPTTSITVNIISQTNHSKTFIILREDGEYYKVSARRQDRKQDMNKLLNDLFEGLEGADGGGHVPAAGGHFLKKDLPEVRKRLGLK